MREARSLSSPNVSVRTVPSGMSMSSAGARALPTSEMSNRSLSRIGLRATIAGRKLVPGPGIQEERYEQVKDGEL
jgi:hypothetical protein